jgi:hypothetical protein
LPYFQDSNLREVACQLFAARRDQLPDLGLRELRATFEVPRKPERKAFDTHALKSMLAFHAEVLTALAKKSRTPTKLRGEARKL